MKLSNKEKRAIINAIEEASSYKWFYCCNVLNHHHYRLANKFSSFYQKPIMMNWFPFDSIYTYERKFEIKYNTRTRLMLMELFLIAHGDV